MENTQPNIGLAIREIRQSMKISLDMAASLTGVSKAMLGQIERGESIPTISTLWKISTGLKVTVSNFLYKQSTNCTVIDIKDITPIPEEEGKMLLYNVFPFNPVSGFDYFYITMEPRCRHKSIPHANVANEYIMVMRGSMEMVVEDKNYLLQEKMAFTFPGFSEHTYANPKEELLVFQNVIRYR